MRGQDRPRRLPSHPQRAERAVGREQRPEGQRDHDRRQHERHRDQRPDRARARESGSGTARMRPAGRAATASAADAAACHTVNSAMRCTRGLAETSATPGRSNAPPGGSGPRPSKRRRPGRRRTAPNIVTGMPAISTQPATRRRRSRRSSPTAPTGRAAVPAPATAALLGPRVVVLARHDVPQPSNRSDHWAIQASRLAAMSAGVTSSAGRAATGANCSQAAGSGDAWSPPGRRTCRPGPTPGTPATAGSRSTCCAPAGFFAPASTPAYSTWRKQVSSSAPVGAGRRAVGDLGRAATRRRRPPAAGRPCRTSRRSRRCRRRSSRRSP